ncbi:MAG: alpha/beta hydrolase [Brevundimonas sp.]|nr:alpha/beta hydrolase [Brevundimonas sp.]
MTGCATARVAESDIYRPRTGGELTQVLVSATAPAYRLERATITARDGAVLRGVWLRQAGARHTVLLFGGNGFLVAEGARLAPLFEQLGVDLMMIDHRGYGASAPGNGTPSLRLLMSDGEDLFDNLASRPGMSPASIVLHGHSLGSFVAGHVATSRDSGALVLQSSATTADDFVRGQIPVYARPFVRVEVADELRNGGNLSNMSKITEPLLIVVGAEDRTTVPAMSRRLYAASPLAPGSKTLMIVAGRGHNDVFASPEAVATYRTFLESLPQVVPQ